MSGLGKTTTTATTTSVPNKQASYYVFRLQYIPVALVTTVVAIKTRRNAEHKVLTRRGRRIDIMVGFFFGLHKSDDR
eukprot:scaffold3632_cov162-Amphora_coffeaeformis.AAC.14